MELVKVVEIFFRRCLPADSILFFLLLRVYGPFALFLSFLSLFLSVSPPPINQNSCESLDTFAAFLLLIRMHLHVEERERKKDTGGENIDRLMDEP